MKSQQSCAGLRCAAAALSPCHRCKTPANFRPATRRRTTRAPCGPRAPPSPVASTFRSPLYGGASSKTSGSVEIQRVSTSYGRILSVGDVSHLSTEDHFLWYETNAQSSSSVRQKQSSTPLSSSVLRCASPASRSCCSAFQRLDSFIAGCFCRFIKHQPLSKTAITFGKPFSSSLPLDGNNTAHQRRALPPSP